MGETVRLRAADGFEPSAYVARPAGAPKGALVVIQEIFGVNGHIRRVADGFAADGYLAIDPALFDRIRPGITLGYARTRSRKASRSRGSPRPRTRSPTSRRRGTSSRRPARPP